MKYLFILFSFLSNSSISQDLYQQLDSTTKAQINLLSTKNKKYFDTLLLNRNKISLDKRIDTIQYDYLFIEESFCYYDSSLEIKELYFSKNDTIPKLVFVNNNKEKLSYFESLNGQNHFNFNELFNRFSSNKLVKRVPYSKIQSLFTGCVPITKKEFRLETKEELKTTFQIQSLVNKDKKNTKVSIQLPPKHPIFKIINGGFIW
jgi:hypothetical protein